MESSIESWRLYKITFLKFYCLLFYCLKFYCLKFYCLLFYCLKFYCLLFYCKFLLSNKQTLIPFSVAKQLDSTFCFIGVVLALFLPSLLPCTLQSFIAVFRRFIQWLVLFCFLVYDTRVVTTTVWDRCFENNSVVWPHQYKWSETLRTVQSVCFKKLNLY